MSNITRLIHVTLSTQDLLEHMTKVVLKCQAQAEDDGLWFRAETAPEAYLQNGLRELHEVIETGLDKILHNIEEDIRKMGKTT